MSVEVPVAIATRGLVSKLPILLLLSFAAKVPESIVLHGFVICSERIKRFSTLRCRKIAKTIYS